MGLHLQKYIRWGVLGTAEIAVEQTIPALQQAKNAEVIAIASLSGKEKAVAKDFAIPKTYETYEALLADPEIDAVYVPLPNHLHATWVKEVAKAGKHVLCEKPAALTERETIEMIDHCDRYGVQFMEAFMHQFHPQHERVKELIASGVIGEVEMIHTSFSFQLKKLSENFRLDCKRGGGSIYDIGCYCIHLIRSLSNSEPVETNIIANIASPYNVDISAAAILRMENGVIGTFNCSMDLPERHDYEVIGTDGTITVKKAYIPQKDGHGIIEVKKETGEIKIEEHIGFNYVLGVEHFSECILKNKLPLYNAKDTIKNMRVLEQCVRTIGM